LILRHAVPAQHLAPEAAAQGLLPQGLAIDPWG
jgi:hypothetical protein